MADQLKWTVDGANVGAAWISGESGYDVAVLQRVARTDEDGIAKTMHGGYGRALKPERHATTDEQWQGIVDLIAAAPEMLKVLRDLRREIRAGDIVADTGSMEAWSREIDAVLAKAEPPRKVKRMVTVMVGVEVEAPADTPLEDIKTSASHSVYTTGGTGSCGGVVRFVSKTVTVPGELYEE